MALAIALAASVDLGRPLQAARAEAEREAAIRAEAVQLAWQRIAEKEAPPGSVQGMVGVFEGEGDAVKGTPPRTAEGASKVSAEENPRENSEESFNLYLDIVLESSDASREALDLVLEALENSPQASRAPEAWLVVARLAGDLGLTAVVQESRTALAARDGEIEGTSIALLSCLVDPMDPELALGLLAEGRAALPSPQDVMHMAHGALEFLGDPWWAALQTKLERSDPGQDWDAAFQKEARMAEATAALTASLGLTPLTHWQLRAVPGGLVAYRRIEERTVVAAVTRASITQRVREEPSASMDAPFSLAFTSEDPTSGEAIFGPASLGGGPLSFSVRHLNPEARGVQELRRQRWLRGALLALAVLVFGTAWLSARALARVRRLAELRSTFVASVSHDLRTPTQAILLLAETLEQNRLFPATDENKKLYHGRIRKEAERLRRLVEDLLDSARIDRGEGARIDRREVELAPFLDELEGAMEERARAAGAELTVTRTGLPRWADLDPDGVRRAIWNLFENALLHGKAADGQARVEVTIAGSSGKLTVTVDDHGPGIPARYAKTAFTPFERLRDHRGRASEISTDTGTGLGLAIVRALARAHGGDAVVLTKENGARVAVSFAFTPDMEAA